MTSADEWALAAAGRHLLRPPRGLEKSALNLNPLDWWKGWSESHPWLSMGASLIPGVGAVTGVADATNAFREGNWGTGLAHLGGAALGALPIPGAGTVGKGVGALTRWGSRLFTGADRARRIGQIAQSAVGKGLTRAGLNVNQVVGTGGIQSGTAAGGLMRAARGYNKALGVVKKPIDAIPWYGQMGAGVAMPVAGQAFDAWRNSQPAGEAGEFGGPATPPGEDTEMTHMASHSLLRPGAEKRAAAAAREYDDSRFEKWAAGQIMKCHPGWRSFRPVEKRAVLERLTDVWRRAQPRLVSAVNRVRDASDAGVHAYINAVSPVTNWVGGHARRAAEGAGNRLKQTGFRAGLGTKPDEVITRQVGEGLVGAGRWLGDNAGRIGDTVGGVAAVSPLLIPAVPAANYLTSGSKSASALEAAGEHIGNAVGRLVKLPFKFPRTTLALGGAAAAAAAGHAVGRRGAAALDPRKDPPTHDDHYKAGSFSRGRAPSWCVKRAAPAGTGPAGRALDAALLFGSIGAGRELTRVADAPAGERLGALRRGAVRSVGSGLGAGLGSGLGHAAGGEIGGHLATVPGLVAGTELSGLLHDRLFPPTPGEAAFLEKERTGSPARDAGIALTSAAGGGLLGGVGKAIHPLAMVPLAVLGGYGGARLGQKWWGHPPRKDR